MTERRIRITGGKLITPDSVLEGYDLLIQGSRIAGILSADEGKMQETDQVIDAHGVYLMPGMIDIHSDMIENLIQPRSTALMDFELALAESERLLAMCGITSMFHSISMYREGTWDVKEIRKASQVRRLAELIRQKKQRPGLIRHYYHLRYEIDNLECYPQVEEMIANGMTDLVSFMDHTPGQGQYQDLSVYRKHQPDEGKNLTDREFRQLVEQEQQKPKATQEQLKVLADLAASRGIAVASHDDDSIGKLKRNRKLGVRISEFPITLEVAKEAVREGYLTVLGAPNILLGGSHSGNLSALQAIREKAADVLVSDYYPQSLLYAVFLLNRRYAVALPEAVAYVTKNPAAAVGIGSEYGSLETGKKADIVFVDSSGELPVIQKVMVNGNLVVDCMNTGME